MTSLSKNRQLMIASTQRSSNAALIANSQASSLINRILNKRAEHLYNDTSSTLAFDTTGSVLLLNGIAESDDIAGRTGRQIRMLSFESIGLCYPQDAAVNDNLCRVILVYDKQTNGAAPVITDVLTASSSIALHNLNNKRRFDFLLDESFSLGARTEAATLAVSSAPVHCAFKRTLQMQRKVQYNNTGATVAAITTGSLYLFTIGSIAATNGHNLSHSTRVIYIDVD